MWYPKHKFYFGMALFWGGATIAGESRSSSMVHRGMLNDPLNPRSIFWLVGLRNIIHVWNGGKIRMVVDIRELRTYPLTNLKGSE